MSKISGRKGKQSMNMVQRKGNWRPGARVLGLATLGSVTLNLVLVAILVALYKGSGMGNEGPQRSSPMGSCTVLVEKAKETKALDISAPPPQKQDAERDVSSFPISEDSVVILEYGDPTMFEPFWKRMADQGAMTMTITGWEKMSYFSDVTNLCWFLEPQLAREVRRLHKLVGNAATEGRHIIVGTGSTQLYQAALYALSPSDATEPMSVVSAVPYYSSFPAETDILRSGLFRWAGDAYTFKGDKYIEVVCSPGNPDGALREAVLNSEAGKTIHDLAYFWPHYTPITAPQDHDVMLFTVSKLSGHAGTRIGWALVKDKDVAERMVTFIIMNTLGVSKDSQVRAAKILKVISDGYELPHSTDADKLFDFGRRRMAARWERLREAVKASGIFSLPDFPLGTCKFTGEKTGTYPAFAWLKCEKDAVEDCEIFLRSHKIITRGGRSFGMGPQYVRMSMVDRDEAFDLCIKRLMSLH